MKHSDWLSVLFGNTATVKLLRLFLFNPSMVVGVDDILRRARLVRHTARTELGVLERNFSSVTITKHNSSSPKANRILLSARDP